MSTTKYNYLPFVQRDIVQLTAKAARDTMVRTGAARISALTPNIKGRAILGDLEVLFYYSNFTANPPPLPAPVTGPGNNFLMRLGWSKRGYLTEERHPYNIMANGYRHWWNTWRFPRPYRMYPGDKLRVEYLHDSTRTGQNLIPFSVGFHGVRLSDNLPVMLAGLDQTLRGFPGRFAIDEPGLACPKDTPVDISVITSSEGTLIGQGTWQFYTPPGLQVYDSANRAWFSQQTNFPAAAAPTGYENEVGWLSFYATPIILGEERGWVHDEGEELIVDMEVAPLDNANVQMVAVVTLRGSLEVEDKHG